MDGGWDVIVIGAGLGGLTAAVRLLNEGRRVLVIDQKDVPGGTANFFSRGPFAFPMGPIGFANPDVVSSALEDLGIDPPALQRVDYRLIAFGKDVLLSQPPLYVARELAAAYPDDAEGIGLFFQLIQDRARSYRRWIEGEAKETLLWSGANTLEYLNRNIHDDRLRRILGSQGTTEPCSDLDLLTAMWVMMTGKGINYPCAGMRQLCASLYRPIQSSAAGRLELGSPVKQIKVRERRVQGVVLENGREEHAPAIISNADFKNTFLRLLSRSDVPNELYRDISLARQTMSRIQVCLGLRSPSLDLSVFEGASRLTYRRNGHASTGPVHIDWRAREIDPDQLADQELEINLLSRDDGQLAPPGGETMVIRVAADYGHFLKFKTGGSGRAPGYFEYERRIAGALIAEAANLIPGLAESIQVLDVATPLTFEERGGRSEGAIGGWSWKHPENDSGVRSLVQTPLSGLYMAGYQAFTRIALGGIPSAVLSGLEAARCVMEEAGPVEKIAIPLSAG